MSPAGPTWEWSDAWLLASIVQADIVGPQELTDAPGVRLDGLANVLACGDATNHAIFTEDELEAGLARLRVAELVATDTYQPTTAGRELSDEASRDQEYALDAIASLLGLLQQLSLPESLPEVRLRPGEVDRAYAAYDAFFERVMRTLD